MGFRMPKHHKSDAPIEPVSKSSREDTKKAVFRIGSKILKYRPQGEDVTAPFTLKGTTNRSSLERPTKMPAFKIRSSTQVYQSTTQGNGIPASLDDARNWRKSDLRVDLSRLKTHCLCSRLQREQGGPGGSPGPSNKQRIFFFRHDSQALYTRW
ncbi:hypothetical protein CC79DRAFT_1331456 [Sarocladium strictum]